MLSNRESKFIKSLQLKKFRQAEGRFVIEGAKNVVELLQSDFDITHLFVTDEFAKNHASILTHNECSLVKDKELEKVGSLKTNNAALAVAKIPMLQVPNFDSGCILAFDQINDPGNLGTIIRIADWYGIKQIICSPDSVDCYNPKVISATMGSFTRVKVFYQELAPLLSKTQTSYATSLDGESIYDMNPVEPCLVFFGNESRGLKKELQDSVKHKIKIPGYGHAESLNVGVSVGIFCDNFMRKLTEKNN